MGDTVFCPSVPLKTAVLFLVYKRPDTTRQVFEVIRKAKPPRLYIAADGPRPDISGEAEKVQQVRDIVLNGVDWDCEVETLFRAEYVARVDAELCSGCGMCEEACQFDAISSSTGDAGEAVAKVNPFKCYGCGLCRNTCPEEALKLYPHHT